MVIGGLQFAPQSITRISFWNFALSFSHAVGALWLMGFGGFLSRLNLSA